jgi:hypothetical protein
MAANCATKQETRPVRALFPKIYSFSDPWIVDDAAARALFRQNPSRTFPSKDAISRFDCARQQAQSTRWWNASLYASSISDFSIRRSNVGIASRMPLKAPINADNRRYRSLDFRFEEFLRTRRAHVGLGDKGYPGIDIG